MSSNVRNILIVVGIALVVALIGGTGFEVGQLLLTILSLLILAGLLYFGYTLYRENRSQIQWLPQKHKLALYGGGRVAVLVLLTSWFWATTFAHVAADVRCPGGIRLRDLPRLAGSPPVLLMATAPCSCAARRRCSLQPAPSSSPSPPASAAPPINDSVTTPRDIRRPTT